ncbi:MAG TPA: protein kinase, partial [Kofleriaceae bacterium]|nr:protein kinase [Kofleriaceae bacterium]
AAQLAHPNVVHIYEFGKVEHDYFIAMEFVDGVHAGQVFKQAEKEKIPPTLVARIGADAAAALHYAHELRNPNGKLYGLVHRDVSPANIMISFDGVVKLCDFGIAKAAAAGDQLTNPGQVKGKYAYMSPEQTIAAPLDGRSDVFSLAIVLWELLTGKYIVPRGDAVAAMRAIRDGKLEAVEKINPTVPPQLAKAINWALKPKREDRATAMDLANSLEEFIKGSPEIANAMQLAAWVRKRFEREGTGQVPAIPATGAVGSQSPGTQASPGTMAAPSTMAGGGTGETPTPLPITPPAYPPRRVVKLMADTGEGTEIYSASDLDAEAAQTIKGGRKPPAFAAETAIANDDPIAPARRIFDRSQHAAEEATLRRPQPADIGDETEIVRSAAPAPDEEDSENSLLGETVMRDRRTPIPSGPTVVPTRVQSSMPLAEGTGNEGQQAPPFVGFPGTTPGTGVNRPGSAPNIARPSSAGVGGVGAGGVQGSGARVMPSAGHVPPSAPRAMPDGRLPTGLPTDAARQKRRRLILTIAGLGGLMLLSFMVALAASNDGPKPTPKAAPKQDGGGIAITPITIDAPLPVAPPPVDAPSVPTVPSVTLDAAIGAGEAYLEVRTIPDGGTVKVGDQSREAVVPPGDPKAKPVAQMILSAGKHHVTVELEGWQPEKREVNLEVGEHQRIEIAFTKKITKSVDRGPAMGRLSVRTTPWSDVYLGSKKLGQAPFADIELPAGTHTLTFTNPSRPTVTKKVKITAGKSTKLNFNLP